MRNYFLKQIAYKKLHVIPFSSTRFVLVLLDVFFILVVKTRSWLLRTMSYLFSQSHGKFDG